MPGTQRMAWDVEINHYMNLAVVTLWGRVSMAERSRALDDLLARIEGGRPYRILVDMIGAMAAPDSAQDVQAHVDRLSGVPLFRDSRVAYLYPDGGRANAALEQHAQFRALPCRRFVAVNDALDWLLAPTPRLDPLPPIQAQALPQSDQVLARPRGRLARWFA